MFCSISSIQLPRSTQQLVHLYPSNQCISHRMNHFSSGMKSFNFTQISKQGILLMELGGGGTNGKEDEWNWVADEGLEAATRSHHPVGEVAEGMGAWGVMLRFINTTSRQPSSVDSSPLTHFSISKHREMRVPRQLLHVFSIIHAI